MACSIIFHDTGAAYTLNESPADAIYVAHGIHYL